MSASGPKKPLPTSARRAAAGTDEAILIVGAGIAGLAATLALARRGFPVHVLERRAAFDDEGAGIQIGPNGTRILAALGVAPLLSEHAGEPPSIRVLEARSGRALARLPLGTWIAERHGAPYWTARRTDLHAALLARAEAEPGVRLTLGVEAAETSSGAGGVSLAACDGRRFSGRALIAADGIWSRLRGAMAGSEAPRFIGKCAARALIPAGSAPEALRSDTHLWLSPGLHVVHYPVAAGRELALVVIADDDHADRDWSGPVESAWVLERTAGLAADLRKLLSTAASWRRWSLHSLPIPESFASGRSALVGDAAHPVLPFLAQGGVLALEDAVVLAAALDRRRADIPAALDAYARARRARVARVAAASRRNGAIYHLSGAMAAARNLALTALPAERLMARYDWLYGWRAEDQD